jgi:hypothetical protein
MNSTMEYRDKNGVMKFNHVAWYKENRILIDIQMEKIIRDNHFRNILNNTMFSIYQFNFGKDKMYIHLN